MTTKQILNNCIGWRSAPGKLRTSLNLLLGLLAFGQAAAGEIAHWNFDKIENGQVVCSNPSYNGRVFGNPQLAKGIAGSALSFAGDGDYIDCGSAPLNIGSGDFTIEFWIKGPQNFKSVINFKENDSNYWWFRGDNDFVPGGMSFDVRGIGIPVNVYSKTTVFDDAWHHVVLTRTMGEAYWPGHAQVYVDGKLTCESTIRAFTETGCKLVIGAINGTRCFSGAIDELVIHNVALSADDISRRYGVLRKERVIDPRDYGAIPDDSVDDSAAIQAAIDSLAQSGGVVQLSRGAYLIDKPLALTGGVSFMGSGSGATTLSYPGSDYAIKIQSGIGHIGQFCIFNTAPSGSGILLHDACRQMTFEDILLVVYGNMPSQSGCGIHLFAENGWMAGIGMSNVFVYGYKYGIRMEGTSSQDCIGQFSLANVWLVGKTEVIPGSVGFHMMPKAHGEATSMEGCNISYFDTGIITENGIIGAILRVGMSGNNRNYSDGTPGVGNRVCASFNGEINLMNSGYYLKASANSTANPWFREQHEIGTLTRETYYNQRQVFYQADWDQREWSIYRGDSLIGGGHPQLKFKVNMGSDGDVAPQRNYLQLLNNKEAWSSAAPTWGNWTKGDIMHNTSPTSGQKVGWICIESGTPGTWKGFGTVE